MNDVPGNDFAGPLLAWFRLSGRHDLPWQRPRTPYRVWISEVMLQQTRVTTVIPYYLRFMERFPDLSELAAADLDEVLHFWTGLGYYSRARNLHSAARLVISRHEGSFPTTMEELCGLPGIGRTTAAAILALAHDQPHPILDGNVKRILCRYLAIRGWPGDAAVEKQLWGLAAGLMPVYEIADYTQAIMDLGALVCTRRRPLCEACPVAADCQAKNQGIQEDLPLPRPGRELPLRRTRFIILEDDAGRILLQQRPPTGIWGGLWSLPESDPGIRLKPWIAKHLGLVAGDIEHGLCFRHTFSHFHLEIEPIHAGVLKVLDAVQDDSKLYWYNPKGDNRRIGLPGPVKQLIDHHISKLRG